jgi:hypothetical protein
MLRSSTYPESSALLSIPLHTPHSRRTVFVDEIEHDSVWTEYLQLAESHDLRMINEWNNFLDVILVFVRIFLPTAYRLVIIYMEIGLLIAILTSFAIGTQKMFSRDPAEVTNELLVYIFNKLSNSSSGPEFPLELDKVTKLGSDNHRKAVSLNLLLFVSLALSIVISMAAMAAKLWLIQYLKLIRSAAPPYDRAMKRQELFSGMESWKFRRVLNTLPLFTLVASMSDVYKPVYSIPSWNAWILYWQDVRDRPHIPYGRLVFGRFHIIFSIPIPFLPLHKGRFRSHP